MRAPLSPADAPQALSEEIFVPHPSDERTLARLVEWAGDLDWLWEELKIPRPGGKP